MKDNAFQVIGYLHGSIGPTGSGWIDSLENFRERNKHNRVALPTRDVPAENNQSSKAFSEPDKKDLYSMFMAVGTNRELVASALDKGDIETAAVA